MNASVLVIAEDMAQRAGLSALLNENDVSVLAELSPSDDVSAWLPGVGAAIWDVAADADGSAADLSDDLWDRLAALAAVVPVLVLTDRPEAVGRALQAGAAGVLSSQVTAGALVGALDAVQAGLTGLVLLEPSLLMGAAWTTAQGADEGLPLEPLTPRERDVLGLLAEGLSNKAIARRLEISDHTVKFHLGAVLGKLAASSRTEAVTKAVRAGLLLL